METNDKTIFELEYRERFDLLTFILIDNGANHKIKTIKDDDLMDFSIDIYKYNDGMIRKIDVDYGDTIYHIFTNLYYIEIKWQLIQRIHANRFKLAME